MKPVVPSESYEQERFVNWLRENGYKYTSIPNGMFTRSYAVKARNKREGLCPGFPDLVICLKGKPQLFFVEMKRLKGGRESPEQAGWRKAINQAGAKAVVCCGHEEAVEAVRREERG